MSAQAHEFWISPQRYEIGLGESIVADFRVGENFKGGAFSFIPRQSERLEATMSNQTRSLEPRIGDRPAINFESEESGLVTIVHQTNASTLTYGSWEKFQKFADHKDFRNVRSIHLSRGLPEADFKESYRRHAKTLIAVGNGAGEDRFHGMKIEIVAITNPYTDDLSKGMTVGLIYDGKAAVDTQIEVFEKAPDETVTVTLHRTDGAGRVLFPVKKGHQYMVDSVALEDTDIDDVQAGPVWHSAWANLTFAVPTE